MSALFSFGTWFFFCKQKTAYEMRISDWSSDVCSSDLTQDAWQRMTQSTACIVVARFDVSCAVRQVTCSMFQPSRWANRPLAVCVECCEIGRASCRERVCQYV